MHWTSRCVTSATVAVTLLQTTILAQAFSPHIRIDAFGYLPFATKIAVLREPVQGFDVGPRYTPAANLEVRRSGSNGIAFRAAPRTWNSGAVHGQSGDRCWAFDFSALQEIGSFYIFDPATRDRSEDFRIAHDVYRDALRAAVRTFYYQRCGTAKATPHAHPNWSDTVCHHGNEQDLDCRSVLDPQLATSRDLSGGWHDAGDYNKYINFADDAVHDLLHAYSLRPDGWSDQWSIPESGNGIADLLDEVRYELEWMLKMQNTDGSVLHKVSVTDFSGKSPPSADDTPRRYAPATASATISGAGVFAHAAAVFKAERDAGAKAFGSRLEAAAQSAWGWLLANPGAIPSTYNNQGFSSADAEDTAYGQRINRLRAAVYLFELTGDVRFRTFFDADYRAAHLFVWGWVSPYEYGFQEAFLRYTTLPGATPNVAAAIRQTAAASLSGADHYARIANENDPYRAPIEDQDYTWGSNRTLAAEGSLFALANVHGLDQTLANGFLNASLDYLHRLHGVNPGGHTYVTNVRSLGAESSVDEMYHIWFGDGTVWDNARTSQFGPAPGYLTGGANRNFAPDAAYTGPLLAPPMNQPPAKSYRDWNTGWPEESWEVTEPAIAYQSAYVRLLAQFALQTPPPRLALHVARETSPNQGIRITLGGTAPSTPIALFVADTTGKFALPLPGWCMDLGLSILPQPTLNLVLLTQTDAQGTLDLRRTVPTGIPLHPWRFQATAPGGCPSAIQSAVVR